VTEAKEPKEPPYTLRVQLAVMASALPKETRHLIHVMAISAGNETGIGRAGQERLAAAMGVSDRHVRSLLAELQSPDSFPVRVERRARFRADGRGRTSDEWRLVLVEGTNRNTVPPEQPSAGTARRTNRNATTDQPEHRSGDLRSGLRSGLRSSSAPRSRKRETAPVAGSHELKLHYVAEYERTRRTKPEFGKRWSRAVKAFGEMVKDHGLDGAKAIVTRALSDQFVKRISPWQLAEDANNHKGAAAKGRPGVPVQRGMASGLDASKMGDPSWLDGGQ
jgi:hypothetical protein